MPTSNAQIDANRANAQLSTGPRTDPGKLKSSQNATKSGLTSAHLLVRAHEVEAFEQFEANLRAEIKPEGELERHLFGQLLHAAWNIRRSFQLEVEIQNEAIAKGLSDALLDNELSKKLDRVYRYKRAHESAQRRALADLRQLQSEALLRRRAAESPAEESILAVSKPPGRAPKPSKTNPPAGPSKLMTFPTSSANVDI